jgi:hypothetical protein
MLADCDEPESTLGRTPQRETISSHSSAIEGCPRGDFELRNEWAFRPFTASPRHLAELDPIPWTV